MKKFRFRLQKLLQIKSHNKLEQQKQLAKAERVRRMEETHLNMLQDRLGKELGDLTAHKKDKISIPRLLRSIYYQHRLSTNMATQKQVILNARKKEAQERAKLLDAAREEKVFEKLKERQSAEYLKELERVGQKETDEIAKNVFLQSAK